MCKPRNFFNPKIIHPLFFLVTGYPSNPGKRTCPRKRDPTRTEIVTEIRQEQTLHFFFLSSSNGAETSRQTVAETFWLRFNQRIPIPKMVEVLTKACRTSTFIVYIIYSFNAFVVCLFCGCDVHRRGRRRCGWWREKVMDLFAFIVGPGK